MREALRKLLLRRQTRLHWRDEDGARRDALAAAVAKIDIAAVVVVGMPVKKTKQERARRQCMETLLHHLGELGVSSVWLESRTQSLNKADAKMVLALRGKKLIRPQLRVETARPLDEPMLWVPDIVAGAVGAARDGKEARWLDTLQHTVTQIEITLG